jgi:hypothetical protein
MADDVQSVSPVRKFLKARENRGTVDLSCAHLTVYRLF